MYLRPVRQMVQVVVVRVTLKMRRTSYSRLVEFHGSGFEAR